MEFGNSLETAPRRHPERALRRHPECSEGA
jgi:hypothetical protein